MKKLLLVSTEYLYKKLYKIVTSSSPPSKEFTFGSSELLVRIPVDASGNDKRLVAKINAISFKNKLTNYFAIQQHLTANKITRAI